MSSPKNAREHKNNLFMRLGSVCRLSQAIESNIGFILSAV